MIENPTFYIVISMRKAIEQMRTDLDTRTAALYGLTLEQAQRVVSYARYANEHSGQMFPYEFIKDIQAMRRNRGNPIKLFNEAKRALADENNPPAWEPFTCTTEE